MRLFKNSYILYFFFGGEGVSGGAPYNGLDIKKIYIWIVTSGFLWKIMLKQRRLQTYHHLVLR